MSTFASEEADIVSAPCKEDSPMDRFTLAVIRGPEDGTKTISLKYTIGIDCPKNSWTHSEGKQHNQAEIDKRPSR